MKFKTQEFETRVILLVLMAIVKMQEERKHAPDGICLLLINRERRPMSKIFFIRVY